MQNLHYRWELKNTIFTKDKGSVFSCFACGGGSTMGYKLAGFNVLGFNEIDKRMAKAYETNHNPKYSFVEPIQSLKLRDDLPSELYNLDILDGSPPCSSFSMIGNREKDWGKQKKFKEGQANQILDTLFFDFIDLAEKLKPRVVVAENVKGLLMGEAKEYTKKIISAFDKAGYFVQHFLLDASKMGVPQKRQRVFFVGLRKDLAAQFTTDLFSTAPELKLKFKEPAIPYKDIEEPGGVGTIPIGPNYKNLWQQCKPGETMRRGNYKVSPDKVLNTITAGDGGSSHHYEVCRSLSPKELILAGSFPLDYDFCGLKHKYIIGMSVPPIMVAKIANEIHNQWLSKI